MVKWKCGEKVRAVLCDTFVHSASKCCLRPGADTGLRIRRDIGRVDHAEWCPHGITTGKHLSALDGVALCAKAAAGQHLPLGDQLRCKAFRRRRRDRSDRRSPGQCGKTHETEKSERDKADQ